MPSPDDNNVITVMVVDDHQLLIDGIKSTIGEPDGIKIVAQANNGKEALEQLEIQYVDVVLMDINMPVMDGLECTRKIMKKYPSVRVIALSQYPEKRFVKNMMKYGALGYLLKDTGKAELIKAIRTVYRGEKYLNNRLYDDISFQGGKQKQNALFPDLTGRELEILRLICDEHSSQEIGERLHISFHTVESHRANLMYKAGVKNTAGLVRWAVENEFF